MATEKYLPGLFQRMWSYFKIKSKPSQGDTGKLIYKGEDLNGNYYFESTDKFGRLLRVVEPKNFKPDGLPVIPEIVVSPEWLRWLRKNRDDPPTEEEMIRNAAIAYLKRQRAAELEIEERKNWPQLDAKLKQIEAERDYHPISLFPLYRDLMQTPGQEFMNNRGFYVPDLRENEHILLEQKQKQQQLSSGENNNDKRNREMSKSPSSQKEP